jgi:hypothetical protein
MSSDFSPGDLVVYAKEKRSDHPSRWAYDIWPDEHGEAYHYKIDKYWIVQEFDEESRVVTCVTRTGKRNAVSADDPHLRKASMLEKLVHKYHQCDEYEEGKKTFPDPMKLLVQDVISFNKEQETEEAEQEPDHEKPGSKGQ